MPDRLRRLGDERVPEALGHGRRQCPQAFVPRRSVTGAIPASFWRAAAAAERSRGALRREWLQLGARGAQQGAVACGLGGVVCGPAGRKGVARARQRPRMERAEDENVIRAQGRDQGTFGERAAEGHGVAVEAGAQL